MLNWIIRRWLNIDSIVVYDEKQVSEQNGLQKLRCGGKVVTTLTPIWKWWWWWVMYAEWLTPEIPCSFDMYPINIPDTSPAIMYLICLDFWLPKGDTRFNAPQNSRCLEMLKQHSWYGIVDSVKFSGTLYRIKCVRKRLFQFYTFRVLFKSA